MLPESLAKTGPAGANSTVGCSQSHVPAGTSRSFPARSVTAEVSAIATELGAEMGAPGTTVIVFPSPDSDTVRTTFTPPTVSRTEALVTVLAFTGSENTAWMGLLTHTFSAPGSGARDTTCGAVRSTTTTRSSPANAVSPNTTRAPNRCSPSVSPVVSHA